MNYEEKRDALISYLDQQCRNTIGVAFSGGVDSSILLKLCCQLAGKYGTIVHSFTIQTVLHPFGEAEEARNLSEHWGAKWHLLQIDEWKEAGIENNPVDRCYRCKKVLFSKLCAAAEKLGVLNVFDGTNEEDMNHYRPGFRAVQELGVISPLHRFGFSKTDVRMLAAELGVETAGKPSVPCLATRFPYNTKLTRDAMERVDRFEKELRSEGYYNVRGRVHDSLLRIEVDQNEIERFISERDKWLRFARELGYTYVTLDLQGFRSGSYDEKMQ